MNDMKLFVKNKQNTPTASLQRNETHPNECLRYDTKQSDGEVPVRLELWRMMSIPLLPLLPDSLWPGVVAAIHWSNRTKPCPYAQLYCLK